ncbi:DUF4124 domain-containing protein [Kineococcus sp. SYSU DK001]|uniref:DUF4124 domain-containing protein n=1 Tax=Kineococcus sp. SYSU DK001 TaxID=3383122 RepID=UPI003D7DDB5E
MRTRLAGLAAVALTTALTVSLAPTATAGTPTLGAGQRGLAAPPKVVAQTTSAATTLNGLYGARSVWKTDVSQAPLAANSGALVANLAGQVDRYYGAAAFNVNKFGTSIYTVDAGQRRIDVKWDNCQRKTYTPRGLLGAGGQFTQVPIPDDAVPAAGTDGQLTIYSPSSDQLWEFWKAKRVDGQWQACWGGRIDRVSTSHGHFSEHWGASASGLAVAGGSILVSDAQAGVIDHALSLQLVNAGIYSNWSWPAQRSDGQDRSADAIPEGTRFRLDPSVDVDALKITPLAKMVAKAAQKYGFIITDKGGAVAITAESPSAVQAATGVNPWTSVMAGKKSYEIFKGFPWDKMQALPKDYGKPTS